MNHWLRDIPLGVLEIALIGIGLTFWFFSRQQEDASRSLVMLSHTKWVSAEAKASERITLLLEEEETMGSENRLLVSHLTLRQLLGYMAISLPFWLVALNWIFGGRGIEGSISAYYHVNYVGAVFVGFLFAIGVFLLVYIGYKPLDTEKVSDNIVANLAGVLALGVAFSRHVLEILRTLIAYLRLFISFPPGCFSSPWHTSHFSYSPRPIPMWRLARSLRMYVEKKPNEIWFTELAES